MAVVDSGCQLQLEKGSVSPYRLLRLSHQLCQLKIASDVVSLSPNYFEAAAVAERQRSESS